MYSLNGIPFKKNRTDGWTHGRTNERTDGPIILCPNFLLEGHKKCMLNYIYPLNCVSVLYLGLLFTHQILFLYPQNLFLGGILESAFWSVDQADGLSVGRSSDGQSVGLSAKSCTFNSSYSFIMIHLILGIHIIQ